MRAAVVALILSMFSASALTAFAQAPVVATFDDAVAASKSSMMADPAAAYDMAVQAEVLSAAEDDTVRAATAKWLQGEALSRMNRPQDAISVIDGALEAVQAAAPASKLYGDLLVARAGVAGATGDYATALSNFQAAHEVFLELGESRARSMALQNIAAIYTDARNYERALHYFELAGEAYAGDPAIDLTRLNNLGSTYKEMGEYAKAEESLRSALDIAREMQSPMLQSRILTNIGATLLAAGQISSAEAAVREGLAQSPDGADLGWEPFLWGVYAQAKLAGGEVDQAAALVARTFDGEDLSQTVMPFREFHKVAHEIYTAQGRYRLASEHLEAFKRLDDEARDVSAAANTALMGAQFDFANQELQIANLRTDALEREVALQRVKQRQRAIFFIGAGVILLLLLAGGAVHYSSMRRSRNDVRLANTRLSDSNVALEKALKAKSEFLATTSHEIRTPLNGILGMTQILMQQKSLAADVRERVQLVHGAGETMKAIVDDILDVAKLETGAISVHAEEFDLKQTLVEVAQIWRDSAERKGLTLSANLEGCPTKVMADQRRLRQIVFNLLSNAVKFTDAGGVELGVKVDERDDDAMLAVTVRDSGEGMPADKLEAIFEPFTQLDGTTTRKQGGTGLGLSICRQLAHALGGTVTVTSTMGEGSTFTLNLPVAVVVRQANPGSVSESADAPTVLVVDSNLLQQSIVEAMLQETHPDVLCADDGVEALQLLGRRQVSAVLVAIDALGEEPGEIVERFMEICERANGARIVAMIGGRIQVEPAMLRLGGADEVIEGAFDAGAAVAALLGDDLAAAENLKNSA